ncbi:hypothetical protein N7524_001475 [Penicillium chrysogenum]|nr:hypothetical protein N7524_001475 [Penicillium chrysogenum]
MIRGSSSLGSTPSEHQASRSSAIEKQQSGSIGGPNLTRGDLIIVPAGVGHRLLEDLHGNQEKFQMVGAYPHGKQWDMCYGKPEEEAKVQRIKDVAWFRQDPLYGAEGPALHV